jgi:metal-responsive CopG/Arc/MetJ family transcriptional regulator
MSSKGTKQTSVRLPKSLLDELDVARHALSKLSVAHLIRDALRDYLDRHEPAIRPVREERDKRGGWL